MKSQREVPVFLTPEEISDRLRVKRVTIYRWLRDGKLKGKKISPKRWLVDPKELEQFLHAV